MNDKENIEKCDICRISLPFGQDRQIHELSANHHKFLDQREKKKGKNSALRVHSCELCNKHGLTLASIMQHFRSNQHRKKFKALSDDLKQSNVTPNPVDVPSEPGIPKHIVFDSEQNDSEAAKDTNPPSSSHSSEPSHSRQNSLSNSKDRNISKSLERRSYRHEEQSRSSRDNLKNSRSSRDNHKNFRDNYKDRDDRDSRSLKRDDRGSRSTSGGNRKTSGSRKQDFKFKRDDPLPGKHEMGDKDRGFEEEESQSRTDQMLERSNQLITTVRDQRESVINRHRDMSYMKYQSEDMHRSNNPRFSGPPFPMAPGMIPHGHMSIHQNTWYPPPPPWRIPRPQGPNRPPDLRHDAPFYRGQHRPYDNRQGLLPTPIYPPRDPFPEAEEVNTEVDREEPRPTNKSIPLSLKQQLIASAKRQTSNDCPSGPDNHGVSQPPPSSVLNMDTKTLMRLLSGPQSQKDKRLLETLAKEGSTMSRPIPRTDSSTPGIDTVVTGESMQPPANITNTTTPQQTTLPINVKSELMASSPPPGSSEAPLAVDSSDEDEEGTTVLVSSLPSSAVSTSRQPSTFLSPGPVLVSPATKKRRRQQSISTSASLTEDDSSLSTVVTMAGGVKAEAFREVSAGGVDVDDETEEMVRMQRALQLSVEEKAVDKSIVESLKIQVDIKGQINHLTACYDEIVEKVVQLKRQKRKLRRKRLKIFTELSAQVMVDQDDPLQAPRVEKGAEPRLSETPGEAPSGKRKKSKSKHADVEPKQAAKKHKASTNQENDDETNSTTTEGASVAGDSTLHSQPGSEFGDETVRSIIRRVIFSEKSKQMSFSDIDTLMKEYMTEGAGDAEVTSSDPGTSLPPGTPHCAVCQGESCSCTTRDTSSVLSDVLSTPGRQPPRSHSTDKKKKKKRDEGMVLADTTTPQTTERKKSDKKGKKVLVMDCSGSSSSSSSDSSSSGDDTGPSTGNTLESGDKRPDHSTIPASSSPEVSALAIATAVPSSQSDISLPSLSTAADDSITTGEFVAHESYSILDLIINKGSVFTSAKDGCIKRFNLETHLLEMELRSPSPHHITCMVLTNQPRDFDRLFTGLSNSLMLAYNVKNGKEIQHIKFESPIQAMATLMDKLYLGLHSGRVFLFDLGKNRSTDNFHVSDRPVTALVAAREGHRRVLLVGSEDQTVSVRDATTGLLLRTMNSMGSIKALTTIGYRVISCAERSVQSYFFTDGKFDATISLLVAVTCLVVTKQYLCVGAVDGTIRIYKVEKFIPNSKLMKVLILKKKAAVVKLQCINNTLIAASSEGIVEIFKIMSSESFKCHFGSCSRVLSTRDDLIYHVTQDHVLTAPSEGTEVPCQWTDCHYLFNTSTQGVKSIEEHIENHL